MIYRWFVLTVAVWVATAMPLHITYDDSQSLFAAAFVLAILNSLVKPLLRLVSLPIIVLSLGLFLVVINALVLRLTAWFVPGFHVPGFWPAVGGSLVISLVSMFLGYSGSRPVQGRVVNFGNMGEMDSRQDHRRPPPGNGPIIDV
jgi:putative membrane protein